MASKSKSAELKGLQTQLAEIDTELKSLNERQSECSRRIRELNVRRDGIQKRVQGIQSRDEIVISEHAYLRYIERILGMDIKSMAGEIVPQNAETMIKQFRSGRVKCDSHTLIVDKGVVVSIIANADKKDKNVHRHPRQGSRRDHDQIWDDDES